MAGGEPGVEDGSSRLFLLSSVAEHRPTRKPPKFKDTLDEVRSFGGWTLNKLEVLRLYLTQFRRVGGGGTYLDAFAGDGRALIDGAEVAGSARIALDSGAFRSYLLFERPGMAAQLATNLAGHRAFKKVQIFAGDSNEQIKGLITNEAIDRGRPCFAMMDPNSTQLAWSTIAALAAYKVASADQKQCKVELWILFNLHQAIQRLWPRDLKEPQHPHVLDRVMGGRTAWIDLWESSASSGQLLGRYCDRLRELGYTWVIPQMIVDPKTSRPQYYMIHATDHDAALKFMRWAKKSAATQLVLPQQIPGWSW